VQARTPSRLARAWRRLRTGVAFAYYGLGGLVLGLVVLPLQRGLAWLAGRGDADLRVQRTIHLGSRSFVWLMQRLGLVRIHWRGVETLRRRPLLVVANHPSLIDTPLLTCCMPQADFIVKAEWSENPFLRNAASTSGYLRAERGADVVRDAAERLRAGRSVVIYPEGARTPPEGLRRFRRGAAHVALEAGCDLLPVFIRVSPRTLMKGQRWTHVPDRTPDWRIEVGEPIHPADHLDGSESRPLAARRLTAIMQELFEKRWTDGDR
jgi:1-acyl-sn-glycerol-3-phosphate acyltransferase